ncbi:MAG: 2Fe-2S iron-sulfur cluster binding domain-containing protein, partial [Oscillospiraceae bacterium]|nr:2Fe-2S iron-sulfur cluster binding domain-containing protein [Oscillospiraceae bacterium]
MPGRGTYDITFIVEGGENATISAAHGENILDLAKKANVAIDAPCSGNGSCGKCRIRLSEGEVFSAITRHINDYEYFGGWRLACNSKVSGPAKIIVPDIASAFKSRLRVTDMSSPLEMRIFNEIQDNMKSAGLKKNSGFFSIQLELSPPTLSDTMPDNERLSRAVFSATGALNVSIRYSLLNKLPDMLRENGWRVRCMLMDNGRGKIRILDLTTYDDPSPMCGLAIDIGTTTISALLVDLETGRIINKGSTGNGQIRFGADVINRIVEQQKPGGVEKLRFSVVRESLLPVIHRLCDDSGMSPQR